MNYHVPDDKEPMGETQTEWNRGPAPEGIELRALAEDKRGEYRLPFNASCHAGVWINARTGEALQTRVVAWRVG